MGCVYSKRDEGDKPFHGRRRKPLKKLAASSEGEDSVVLEVDSRVGRESIDGGRVRLIPEPKENVINLVPHLLLNGVMNGSTSPMNTEKVAVQERWGSHDGRAAQANVVSIGRDSEVKQQQQKQSLFSSRVTNGALTEYAAAGWPYWLTKVAGEAVKGWLPRKLDSFANMEKIGQGTYSTVYKAHDLVTGQIVALKKVRFANLDAESIRFMAREIYVLRRLDHPNVIKLEGLVASKMSNSLWLIFQYMEHDLAGLAARPGISFSLSQVKCFMKQLFNGLTHCHNNGVLHRDIKGANLLINDDGILKLADFGLATFFSSEQKHPLTSRVVTLWYRPPELLLGAQDYGVSVDLWSAGCILAELLTGKPIMPGRTEVEQLHMIFKLCGSPSEEYWMKSKLPHATIFKPQHPYKSRISQEFKDFPTTAVQLLERLLAVDPADRGTSSATLLSEFFTVEPMACDPSDLPKYPPSKELDAKKLRDVEFGRNKEATKKKNDHEFGREVPKYSKGMPVLEANAEFKTLHENSRSIGDKYNPREDAGMRNPDDRPRPKPEKRFAPPEEYGASMIKNSKDHHSSFGKLNNPHASRSQRSHLSNGFSGMSGPLENSRTSTKFADKKESHEQSGHHRQLQGSSYSQLQTNGDEKGREPKAAYIPKRNRIMYSGPLIPTMDNIDEMLKEHERQIEQAVRKACNEKMKNTKYGTKGQPESLLRTGGI